MAVSQSAMTVSARAPTASGRCSAAARSPLRVERTPQSCRRRKQGRRLLADAAAALPPHATELAAEAAAAAATSAAAAASSATNPPAASPAAAAALATVPPLASVVPEFPRLGGQPVRDWIGAAVENLQGFNSDDAARLLLPDLVGLAGSLDLPTLLIGGTLVLAFIYWEGGILLQELRERQRRQSDLRRRQRDSGVLDSWGGEGEGEGGGDSGWGDGAGDEALQAERQRQRRQTRMERARLERRRGLGWLALVTAAAIWLTGVGNFQP